MGGEASTKIPEQARSRAHREPERKWQPGFYFPTCTFHLYAPHITEPCERYGKQIPGWIGWVSRCGAYQARRDVELRSSYPDIQGNWCKECDQLAKAGKTELTYDHELPKCDDGHDADPADRRSAGGGMGVRADLEHAADRGPMPRPAEPAPGEPGAARDLPVPAVPGAGVRRAAGQGPVRADSEGHMGTRGRPDLVLTPPPDRGGR